MNREVIEGVQTQGSDEKITYTVTVSPYPTSIIDVSVYDERTDLDVTATVMPQGSASFTAGTIMMPPLTDLTLGRGYRVEIRYTDGVNILEPYFRVYCQ